MKHLQQGAAAGKNIHECCQLPADRILFDAQRGQEQRSIYRIRGLGAGVNEAIRFEGASVFVGSNAERIRKR